MASDCTIHGGVPGEVDSFNGRSGIVVAEAGDYDEFYTRRASAATYFQRVTRTSGSLTPNTLVWADLENSLDLTLTALAGDVIEVGISGLTGNENAETYLDVVSLVAGVPVRSWASGAAPDDTHTGVGAWYLAASFVSPIGGSIALACAIGDLAAGSITLRYRVRQPGVGLRTIYGLASVPLVVWARNHG